MDWRIELSVKDEDENVIPNVLLKSSNAQAWRRRGSVYIKTAVQEENNITAVSHLYYDICPCAT